MSGLEARLRLERVDGFRVEAGFDVLPGQTVALLGPNGAGKSTVVAAIAGLLPLEAGRIVLGERVLDDPDSGVFVSPEERCIGVVFQDLLLFDHLDVVGNVAYGPRRRGSSRDAAGRRAGEWLERLGIDALASRSPRELSGGQAQLVALARALAAEPEMLLLDEPLSALDLAARTRVRRALGEHLAGFAGPRLLITHDPLDAYLLADEIIVMEGGEITQQGTKDEIRLRPRTRYVADLAGANFLVGSGKGREVLVGGHTLHVAEHGLDGEVFVTIHPTAISVHADRPGGSPRNAWPATVERVESLGDRVRLLVGPPLPITAEVTESARSELAIEPGSRIWVAIKATEIGLQLDTGR